MYTALKNLLLKLVQVYNVRREQHARQAKEDQEARQRYLDWLHSPQEHKPWGVHDICWNCPKAEKCRKPDFWETDKECWCLQAKRMEHHFGFKL